MGESEAMMAAENALREGDCRKASESYLAAALASSDASVAAKASQLAVGCEQLGPARAAAQRWLQLEPYSGDAALTAALVALKRYDLPEARKALTAWRDSGSAGSQDPLRFAELLGQETEPTAVYRVFREVLVGDEPTADVLLAESRLALAAQNMNVAREAAARALKLDSDLTEARVIELRAQSVQGEHEAAIAGARALDGKLADDDVFLLSDLLTAADRADEARRELDRLGAQPAARVGAERRLIALDLQDGNFDAAEKRLTPLLGERGTTALALLIAAQIAEQRGDDTRAMQSYRLLIDSSLALTARSAAARLLIKHGDTKSAVALLDDYAAQNPESRVGMGATKAQLLAQAGDLAGAVATLDDLEAKYPGHPDIEYQRATVLETGGRTREALAQFERALKTRPDDPQLSNALAFTLADHGQRLDRAETLVRHAIGVSPDNPAIQDTLGWVLFRRGKVKESLPILQRAWRNSGDGEIAAHYGEALWKSGDEGQARYVWQQALNTNPAHEGLKATMSRLTGEGAGKR
ncbi:MAG TPA: tetratricopeptide repeat protein [Steroidobacteraceae bacterium]|nr:tetratricopeptide repeat protein [Steroidobacteraceae bacterium]